MLCCLLRRHPVRWLYSHQRANKVNGFGSDVLSLKCFRREGYLARLVVPKRARIVKARLISQNMSHGFPKAPHIDRERTNILFILLVVDAELQDLRGEEARRSEESRVTRLALSLFAEPKISNLDRQRLHICDEKVLGMLLGLQLLTEDQDHITPGFKSRCA